MAEEDVWLLLVSALALYCKFSSHGCGIYQSSERKFWFEMIWRVCVLAKTSWQGLAAAVFPNQNAKATITH
jgi:hypothetical protein